MLLLTLSMSTTRREWRLFSDLRMNWVSFSGSFKCNNSNYQLAYHALSMILYWKEREGRAMAKTKYFIVLPVTEGTGNAHFISDGMSIFK